MNGQQPPNIGHHAPPSPYTPIQHQQPDYAAQTAAAALSSATAPPPHQQLQPQHVPTPNNSAAPNGRKRKAGQPGSRGVANLTPDQLAKKRANDREAQRAIRERTKNTIESLERRIRELENQQPYQELQRALGERDRALQECEELRKRLSAVAGIVGNRDLGQTGLNGMVDLRELSMEDVLTENWTELAALTAQQSPLPPINGQQQQQAQQQYPQQPPSGQYDQPPQQHLHPELRSPHSSHTAGSPVQNGGAYQGVDGNMPRWSEQTEQHPQQGYPTHAQSYEQQHNSTAQMQHQPSTSNAAVGDRLGLSYVLGQQHHSPHSDAKRPTDHHSEMALKMIDRQKSTCTLDKLLKDFVASLRNQMDSGTSLSQLLNGSDRPAFVGLTTPEIAHSQHCDPISAILIDILSKFPDIEHLPERMAVLYVMYYILRWQICPCDRCWDLMPKWAQPVVEATQHDHGAWSDYLPWPIMRSKLAASSRNNDFNDFFVPFTLTLSLNWRNSTSACLVPNPDTKSELQMVINPEFEDHLLRLDQWSLGKEFVDAFSDIIDESVRIIEQPHTRSKQHGRGFVEL